MTTRKAYPLLQHACRLKWLIAKKVKGSPLGKLCHLSAYTIYWQHLRSCLPLQDFQGGHCGQDNILTMEN